MCIFIYIIEYIDKKYKINHNGLYNKIYFKGRVRNMKKLKTIMTMMLIAVFVSTGLAFTNVKVKAASPQGFCHNRILLSIQIHCGCCWMLKRVR